MSEHEILDNPSALLGFQVEAMDGGIGHVIDASPHALLVRSRWSHRHVVIPARAVSRIDVESGKVWLDRTRHQVSLIPQPKGSEHGGWFFPAFDQPLSGEAAIGSEPAEFEGPS